MALSVCNLIESVCNPIRRFKMLQGVVAKIDDAGEPAFFHSAPWVNFPVLWNGKSYLLKCFLWENVQKRVQGREVSAYLQQVHTPFLVDYYYLSDEMLVFTDHGQPVYIDVILMEYPEQMLTLDLFVDQLTACQDSERLFLLLVEFCCMGVWLMTDRIVHGAVRPTNLLVDPQDCSVRLINYEWMRISTSDNEALVDNDNHMLANLALGLKVLAGTPDFFRYLRGNPMFHHPVARSGLLPVFSRAAFQSDCKPMARIVDLLFHCNQTLKDRAALILAMQELAVDRTSIQIDLSSEFSVRCSSASVRENTSSFGSVLLDKTELDVLYHWVGEEQHDGLRCVENNDLWGFIDASGEEVLPLRYNWTSDFSEGRAEIQIDGYFGLIDKKGREILAPIYEVVEWNCAQGIVKVECDGAFGLCDRDGNQKVPFIYDWMGDVDTSLIAVGLNRRYGYIRSSDGSVAIPLQYDEAYGFIEGQARVELDGRKFTIDLQGDEVDPQQEAMFCSSVGC